MVNTVITVSGINKIYFRSEEKWDEGCAVFLSKDEKDCERVELKNLDAANNFCVDFDTNKYDHIYFENKNGVKTSRVYPGNSSIGVEYKLAANGNTLTHIFTRDIDESTGRVDNFELTDEKNLAYRDDKSKKISVFVPSTYDASTPADILYFFDAQNLFCNAGKYTENGDPYGSWQLDVALKNLYEERGKNVIVVGIDNADKYRSNELFMDHRKFGELSPLAKNIEGDNFSTGYLDGLSDFIVNTLHPFIKQKYNVKEDNIGIGGSSMGGIASFYCALHKMGFYKYVLSYSPAYGLYEMDAFESYFKTLSFAENKEKLPAIHIYCGEGDDLEKKLVVSSRAMKKTLVDHGYKSENIFETYDIEKPHNEESWRLILPQSFKYLYK